MDGSEEEEELGDRVLDHLTARYLRHESESGGAAGREGFDSHTVFFGLFLRTVRMERVFLDGFARLHQRNVYLGLVVLLVVLIVYQLYTFPAASQQDRWCSENNLENSLCTSVAILEPGQSEASYLSEQLAYVWRVSYSVLVGMSVVGAAVNWFVHRSSRVKEKSWAMLILFLTPYIGYSVYALVLVYDNPDNWLTTPTDAKAYVILVVGLFTFISGASLFAFVALFMAVAVICSSALFVVQMQYLDYPRNRRILRASFAESMFQILVFFSISLAGSFWREVINKRQFLLRILMADQQEEIIRSKTQNTTLQKRLLNSMLPDAIVDRLQELDFQVQTWDQLRGMSRRHSGVCIAFAELDGFTEFSAQVSPPRVMEYLCDLFLTFDGLCDDYDVYKVETVGDQYVAAVGVVTGKMHNEEVREDEDGEGFGALRRSVNVSVKDASKFNTEQILGFSKAIIDGSRLVNVPEGADTHPRLRVGIHVGPCMSGIVGQRNFRFCLFGDTMNTAARMEQKGEPDCIHATQDVVDLVPHASWEKLQRMEVKGKGVMQTYLLRSNKEILTDSRPLTAQDAFLASPLIHRIASFGTGTSAWTSTNTAESFRVGSYQDIQPVTSEVYSEHTFCFGLFFRKARVEKCFLDALARSDKNMVYAGYLLYVVVLLSNYIYGYFRFYVVCDDIGTLDSMESFNEGLDSLACLYYLGSDPFLSQNNSASTMTSYKNIVRASAFNLTPGSAALLLGLVVLGCASHFYIHKSRRFVHKYWALLNVWVFYLMLYGSMLGTTILTKRKDSSTSQWTEALWFISVTMDTLQTVFARSGFPMHFIFLMIGSGITLGWGMTELAKVKEASFSDKNGDNQWIGSLDIQAGLAPTRSTSSVIQLAFFLLCFNVILVIGAYQEDISNRKRFLQSMLLLRQQDEIIAQKRKTEKLQKSFLESILPSNLVEQLQEEDRSALSLSQRHIGVSILYADLVGFTAFCKQVDPFEVMVFLNSLFRVFDDFCDLFGVYKVETVGDCYVASVGVATGRMISQRVDATDSTREYSIDFVDSYSRSFSTSASISLVKDAARSNTRSLVGFAKAMLLGSRKVMKPVVGQPATLRIGLHSGSCISGVVGSRNIKYCLLGTDVVTAAMMEHEGAPDRIHASQAVVDDVPEEEWEIFKLVEDRDGNKLQTYFLKSIQPVREDTC
ncbi:guanylate cyclase [Chloropicon primus]|nr:guanylate cyclase [Chloropicon primus]UPR04209.1 guanylate cyclase [Chloropicon primus]